MPAASTIPAAAPNAGSQRARRRCGLRPRRCHQLRIQRAMRHRTHGRIDLRIGFGLRQLAIERSQARVLLVHEGLELALEFFVAAHSFNFSRNFANA
jgi:hypothetical protein